MDFLVDCVCVALYYLIAISLLRPATIVLADWDMFHLCLRRQRRAGLGLSLEETKRNQAN
ncbi:hypothetical protein FIBSPDRAFT_851739 [Athelia psychrophila]|uniref:Uncharacterized protein n=1 Tax=Athelia psychrophila TaxID=1759441 RepID=A0A166SDN1_9AGAM|nr:hypothetical protein FIBSPDRAFT_851739 [Fibularhizoctonia sp. CBS 109695]